MNTSTNDRETVVIYYSICLAMCYDRGQDTYKECMDNYYMTLNDYDFINLVDDCVNYQFDDVQTRSILYTADAVKDECSSFIKEDIDIVLPTDRFLVVGRKVDKKFIEFVIANNGKPLENRIEEQWKIDHGCDPVHEVVDIISYRPVIKDNVFVDWEKDLNDDGEYNKEPEVEIGEHPSDIIRCPFTHSTIDECSCITCITIRRVNNDVK